MSDSDHPQQESAISARPRWPTQAMELPQVLADDASFASRLRGLLRRCGKCGSRMTLVGEEDMFLNGFIPSGKRFYFQCCLCGKRIKVRSLWRNLLMLPFCLIFVKIGADFASSPN